MWNVALAFVLVLIIDEEEKTTTVYQNNFAIIFKSHKVISKGVKLWFPGQA